MADTKTPVIEIRTLEAVKSVKDLKDNIAALKAKIEDVNTSTEDYSDLVSQLSQNQAALRNVMNGTHSSFQQSIQDAQGLNTSYNSLVQQLKDATQEWRAIPKYLSDADKAQGLVNQAWTDAATKVSTLRTELKGMDSDTGSYVRNVGNYKSALEGFSGSMGQLQQVGGDMVNGISAAASSMAMLGIESEGLSKSMNNLRIVTAAVQGAKGFAGLIKTLASYFKAGKNATAATKAQTVATQAEATAQNAANAATAQGSVALNGLQKALIATGIGALVVGLGMLVAHFEDIVNWIGKLGEKFGLWKRDTYDVTQENEKLNKAIDKQNHALENEQKIRSAQGASNITLLKQKKELVQQQINDTKATIENVKARIEQLKADDRWWKFWQGTKGKVNKANEELKELEETLENLNQINTDIDVDITVEGINQANKAAENAKKQAEDALKLAQQLVDKGINAATKAIQSQETELQKINREHKENVDLINSAITATQKLTGQTENLRILQSGLTSEEIRYNAAKDDYYKNEYEAKVAAESEKIAKAKAAEYEEMERIEEIRTGVLGLDKETNKQVAQASAARQKEYDILKEQFEMIKKDIPFEVFADVDLKAMTPKEIKDIYGEPTTTAILKYFETEKKLQSAGNELAKEILTGYEDAINVALENGHFGTANILQKNLSETLFNLFGNNEEMNLAANRYIESISAAINQAFNDYEPPQNNFFKDLFGGFDAEGLVRLGEMRKTLDLLKTEGKEASDEFVALNEKATTLSMKLWDNYFGRLGKHFSTYGKATANVMDSVADAWEAALQAQVKNGKKSEKEAKRSFGYVKALQLSSAVINASAAVVQALADPTVPSYYVKVANAAAAAAAGIAQVIKISNTEFSASASNSTENTPQLVDRTPQLQYTIGLNSAEYAAAQAENPIKAYVVDKELSEGLDNYNRRRDETSF